MPEFDIKVLEADTFDTRLTQRHIQQGRLTHEQLEAHRKALPDVADEGEDVVVHVGVEPPTPSDDD